MDDGFPADHFVLSGTPSSISTSGGKYSSFGSAATTASGHIRSLDTTLFVGPEADKYREGMSSDLPPHLDTTGTAYTMVGGALSTFSTALSGFQERMSPLRTQAPGLWQALQNAKSALATAKTNDSNHTQARQQAAANLKDGQQLPPDTYQAQTGSASSSVSSAQQAWDTCYNAATTIKTEHSSAVDTCVNTINDAAGKRFHKNPSGWGALTAGFKSWVSDHVAALSKLSGILKTISAVAGVLSFIPVIGEIAAPIALITGVAALAIDASIKYATGKGSWKSIIIDGALLALPGVGKIASKGMDAYRGARGAETLASETRTLSTAERGLTDAGENNPIVLTLKYKKSWTPAQIAEADRKVAQLQTLANDGKLIKSPSNRTITSLRNEFKKANGANSVTKSQDVDHIHELQLGGKDELSNTQALDRSVNRSVGSQIKHQIKGHSHGTQYGGVTIGPR